MKSRLRIQRLAFGAIVAYLSVVFVMAFMLRLGDMRLPETVGGVLDGIQGHGLLLGVRFGHVEAAANILFFVPLGMLLPLVFSRRRIFVGWCCAVGLSVCIELVQYFFLDGRVGSVRDVICNALGAAFGALLTCVVVRIRTERARRAIQ
ncbi:VanZ family protein [Paeniglutamicibacter sp.]|uniref:VanZ family protein n=1 Tax=Paeniglutamicibacter sp. TaxID=1934391 RepID=UPI003988AEBC